VDALRHTSRDVEAALASGDQALLLQSVLRVQDMVARRVAPPAI
jgi:hypothetical protein